MRAVWAGMAVLAALASPAPALAHPHIFIDAALEVVFAADGRADGFADNAIQPDRAIRRVEARPTHDNIARRARWNEGLEYRDIDVDA